MCKSLLCSTSTFSSCPLFLVAAHLGCWSWVGGLKALFSSLFLMYQEAADRAIVGISPVSTPENPSSLRERIKIRYKTTIIPTAPNTLMSIHRPPTKVINCQAIDMPAFLPWSSMKRENETHNTKKTSVDAYNNAIVTTKTLDCSTNMRKAKEIASIMLR